VTQRTLSQLYIITVQEKCLRLRVVISRRIKIDVQLIFRLAAFEKVLEIVLNF
jgi:hypothetical protein